MNDDTITDVRHECERLLRKIDERAKLPMRSVQKYHAYTDSDGELHPACFYDYREGEGAANGSVKRASLDLTRLLAKMRKGL